MPAIHAGIRVYLMVVIVTLQDALRVTDRCVPNGFYGHSGRNTKGHGGVRIDIALFLLFLLYHIVAPFTLHVVYYVHCYFSEISGHVNKVTYTPQQ